MNSFIKNKKCMNKYLVSINKPPGLCETRWGSFLKACVYYNSHFNYFYNNICKEITNSTERNAIIAQAADFLESIHADLSEIVENYGFLINLIKTSQNRNFNIKDALAMKEQLKFTCDPAKISNYIDKRWSKHPLL